MSVDVTNRNCPAATPPTSLSLRSSHNQLLSGDVVRQGSATPPKCRKKYALTSIQAAMGLGEVAAAAAAAMAAASSSLPASPSRASTANNLKLAKNGANQLRKAGQDHNKNTTDPEAEATADEFNVNVAEEHGGHALTNNDPDEEEEEEEEEGEEEEEVELHSNTDAAPEQKTKSDTDCEVNAAVELQLNGNTTTDIDTEESDDISILSEKEMMSRMKIEEDGDEAAEEEQENEEDKPLLSMPSEPPVQKCIVSPCLELISDLRSNLKLQREGGKDSPVPPPPSPPKQASPEDVPLLSVASCSSSCSSSSSPDTKKDRRTGAKTDCALNRIQNLNPSDEELSWTTLSQESNSPQETGTHGATTRCRGPQTHTLAFHGSVGDAGLFLPPVLRCRFLFADDMFPSVCVCACACVNMYTELRHCWNKVTNTLASSKSPRIPLAGTGSALTTLWVVSRLYPLHPVSGCVPARVCVCV